jgi:hypothetical protein
MLTISLAAAAWTAPIVLKEYLGRRWAPEVLTYPYTAAKTARVLSGSLQVTVPEGRVPAQFTDVECWPGTPYVKSATLALVSGLEPLQTRTFQVATGAKAAPPLRTDLTVTPGAGTVEIATTRFGLRLLLGEKTFDPPVAVKDVPGPIAGLRTEDGRWYGGSRLFGPRTVKGYRAVVTEQGPALARWQVRYTYDDGSTAAVTIQLGAGMPRAWWETRCSTDDAANGWALDISTGLEPLRMLWRPEYAHNKWGSMVQDYTKETGWDDTPRDVTLAPEPEGVITKLTPWADWWDGTTQIAWTFKTGPKQPVFTMRRIEAGAWVEPGPPGIHANGTKLQQKQIPLVKEPDGVITMQFPNAAGLRRLEAGTGEFGDGDASAPPKYCYAGFDPSLNIVKDWVLEWPDTRPYPRLYISRAQLEKAWKRADLAEVEAFYKANVGTSVLPNALHPWTTTACLNAWLMVGTPEMATRVNLIEHLRYWLARRGEEHFNTPKEIISLYDGVMTAGGLTAQDTALFRAQMAYIAYALDDPTTWSIERSYCSGNEDMTVARIISKGLAACELPDHPRAKVWAVDALRMMDKWLGTTGPAGEWPESASGYTIPSTGDIFTFALAASHAGLADFLNDPRLKRMLLCTAKQYSPPDPRTGGSAGNAMKAGESRIPPVGDAIAFGSGVIGQMASAMTEQDPHYAAELQWVWKRSGMTGAPRLVNPDLPAPTPDWSLDVFPRLGAIARAGLDSGKEDFLYLVTSDSLNTLTSEAGSITAFFSKGVPLVSSFLARYTWRQAHLGNRVCLAIKNPTYQANQLTAWHSGNYGGIWSGAPHGIFDERVGPSTTTSSADLPWGAYLQADFTLRAEVKVPGSEKIADLPDWPEMENNRFGRLPLDWRRQLLLLTDDTPGGMHYLVARDTVKGGATRWQMWTTSEKIGTPEEVADPAFLAAKPGFAIVPPRELPQSDRYTAVGRFGVDLDYYIASPADTPRHTLRWGTQYYQYNTLAGYQDVQDLLHLQMPGDGAYFVAMVPRTAGAPAPSFATLADGTIIKVSGAFGTDYAFLNATPADADAGDAVFHGTAAAVQNRNGTLVLTLHAPGRVRYKDFILAADAPASLRVDKTGPTLFPAKGQPVTASLTLPGAWKLAEAVKGVTLTSVDSIHGVAIDAGVKANGTYNIKIESGVKAVKLMKE